MTLPTFLICGIQKGGTTALHAYLAGHPDVFCPERKELNFFDQNWERGLAWYERHFEDAAAHDPVAIGEASPHYQRFETAARRIADVLPEARLLFVLREPVGRAWSNYNYNLGRGQQAPGQSFEAAIATEDGRERYLEKGHYLADLERFAEICGRERMRVLFAEDLRTDPAATLRIAFEHIGVDPERWEPTTLSSNTTAVPTSAAAQRALYRWGQVRERIRPLVPAPLAKATLGLRKRALAALPSERSREPLADETRAALAGHYAEANRGLADWLRAGPEGDRALPAWLETTTLRVAG